MIRLFIVALLCSIASSASFADEANAADGACIPWLNQSIGKLNSSQEHDLCALTAADDAQEIAEVCFINYGVNFPMTSEIKVKGSAAHPIFKVLATKGEPRWNFNKYLISKQGEVIAHYDSTVTPESAQFVSAVEQQL